MLEESRSKAWVESLITENIVADREEIQNGSFSNCSSSKAVVYVIEFLCFRKDSVQVSLNQTECKYLQNLGSWQKRVKQ